MSNTNLGCSATSCAYNEDCKCFAGNICVGGKKATTTSSTCCESFVDKADASFTNCSDCGGSCTCTSDIHCKAENCTYNENCKCCADDVNINCHDASCETFKCD